MLPCVCAGGAIFRAWSSAAVLGACLLFVGGFALFATHVSRMATPKNPAQADAIIVLTGGQARLDAAVDLLKSGKGERLLISGVHPSTTRKTLQAATGGDKTLFSCCVDIDRDALDTIGNAEESAKWVRNHAYGRVILVTNNYHMPRSLLEVRQADRRGASSSPTRSSTPTSAMAAGWCSRRRCACCSPNTTNTCWRWRAARCRFLPPRSAWRR